MISPGRPSVAIVDHSLGNLFSVLQACRHVGLSATITDDAQEIESADAVILPGVGGFPRAMAALSERGLVDVLREAARSGKPFVGICLGMQLLFDSSEEIAESSGLGVISGVVKRFPSASPDGHPVRIPQVGWNRLEPVGEIDTSIGWGDPLLADQPSPTSLYFVHSFYVSPADSGLVTGESSYAGLRYCAAVRSKNVVGYQFHPERSGPRGLQIYNNLADMLRASSTSE